MGEPKEVLARRQAARAERERALGMVRLPVWVPDTPEARAELKLLVERLRADHLAARPEQEPPPSQG